MLMVAPSLITRVPKTWIRSSLLVIVTTTFFSIVRVTPALTLIPPLPIVYGLQSSNKVRSEVIWFVKSLSTESQLVSVTFKVTDWSPSSVALVTLLTAIISDSSASVTPSLTAVTVAVPVVAPGRINIVLELNV